MSLFTKSQQTAKLIAGEITMELFITAILIGLLPAFIAQGKGQSFVLWWIYGASIFIVALPHSLIMKADQKSIENQQLSEGMKKCPDCAEMIKQDAKVCRYCSRDLVAEKTIFKKFENKRGEHHWSDDNSTHNIESRCPSCGDFFHGSEYSECTKCNCRLEKD